MKSKSLIVVSLTLLSLFSISAFAQVKPNRIAVINTAMFANKTGGIKKYLAQQDKLNLEFSVVNKEINDLIKRINTLKTEIGNMQKTAQANPNGPVKPTTIRAKAEEHDRLVREIKFKQDGAKAQLNSRRQILLDPIKKDIFKVMQEFSTKKGYTLILDVNRSKRANFILAYGKQYDVTKAFIAYYNARPAGTATK